MPSQSLDTVQPQRCATVQPLSGPGVHGSIDHITAGRPFDPVKHLPQGPVSHNAAMSTDEGCGAFDEELLAFVAACGMEVPLIGT